MSTVRLRVFGGLRMWRSGVEVDTGPVRQQIVLAVLIAARGAAVTTAELVDILWGERPSPSAVNQVQRLIGQVRRLFEPDLPNRAAGRWVHPSGNGYRLQTDGRTCDLTAFFDIVADARAAAAQHSSRDALQGFEQALMTAEKQPFAGLPAEVLELPVFVALAAVRTAVAAEVADLTIGMPSAYRLVPLISRYAGEAPLHEPLQARMIRLLTASGRRAEALMQFEKVRRRLADDLGTDPGVELRAAHLQALTDPDEPDPDRPAQLPARLTGLTARDDLAPALDAGRRSSVVVLSGMGGAGKTTLAVDWAHRIAVDFPDGHLYLNLRGFDAGNRQLRPIEALHTLLESIGIDPSAAGNDVEACAARLRSALADRRMILLLDNARDSAQVRPLLPGAPGCLVIVTSRNRLPGLVTHEGAWPVHVGRMSHLAARDLLGRRLGTLRLRSEAAAIDELIRLCAGLPLALSIAAAQIAVSPHLRLADVVAGMRSAARRLDALETGERQDDVRSAFSWSYGALEEPAARLFRLLAVHPSTEFSAQAAASIAGVDVRTSLSELCLLSMVTRLDATRYTMHDLLGAYAAELLDTAGDERETAEARLVEHYVHSSRNAYLTFGRVPPLDPDPPSPSIFALEPHNDAAALNWYTGERAAVGGIIDLALQRGETRSAALIVLQLRPLRSSSLEAPPDSLDQTLRVLRAVEQLDDPALETMLLREAAIGLRLIDPLRARGYLFRALALAQAADDLLSQTHALRSLGCWPPILPAGDRLAHLRWALDTARLAQHPSALVFALEALAKELLHQNAPVDAAVHADEAFERAEDAGMADFRVELATLRSAIALKLNDGAAAMELAEWALEHAAPADNYTVLGASPLLAEAYLKVGDRDKARAAVNLVQELLERHSDAYLGTFGAAEMDKVRTKIDGVITALGSSAPRTERAERGHLLPAGHGQSNPA